MMHGPRLEKNTSAVSTDPRPEIYDFIVVGSGSSGGVVASRLSESGKYSVLCVEAGKSGANFLWSRAPAGTAMMIDDPRVNWRYRAEPHSSVADRQIYVPRGKLLGGSSALNATIYNRGQRIDYDTWAQMGCTGWSYEDVLPFFRKLEATTLGEDAFRGRDGPIRVTESENFSPFFDLFMASAQAYGLSRNKDYSGAKQEGFALAQQTTYQGLRESTATAYLAPARRRRNLTISAGTEVTSLVLDGKKCIGIRVEKNGKKSTIFATREVVLSCGAVNTPKLLELSGIGNPEVLTEHGVSVIHPLPGVGEHMRDHFAAQLKWRFNQAGISVAKRGRGWRLVVETLRYAVLRRGFIAHGLGTMRVFVRSRPEIEDADIMMGAAPYLIEMKTGESRAMSPIEGFLMNVHVQRTESIGNVHIRSADPHAPPAISFRFLETPGDRSATIAGVRIAREIVAREPLADVIEAELSPGPYVRSDEEILAYVRENGTITHHIAGTCSMGNHPLAVVDPRLRVHGLQNLRIADASVMPTITSGNTSVPCMMIGEKCADMIIADTAS